MAKKSKNPSSVALGIRLEDEVDDYESEFGDELEKAGCKAKLFRDDIRVFRKCYYKQLTLDVGDYVMISDTKDDDTTGDIGRIICFYENKDPDFLRKRADEKFRAIVAWFVNFKAVETRISKPKDYDIKGYEVVETFMWDSDIDIGSIYSKDCNVEPRTLADSGPPRVKQGWQSYICRYKTVLGPGRKYVLEPCFGAVQSAKKANRRKTDEESKMPPIEVIYCAEPIIEESNSQSPPSSLKVRIRRQTVTEETPTKVAPARRKSILKTPNQNNGVTPKKRVSMSAKLQTYREIEEDENITPPKRSRHNDYGTPKGRKTHASAEKKTPRGRRSLLTQLTIGQRATPVKSDGEQMQIARERLHVSAVPKILPCREKEFNDIYTFLEDKLVDDCGGCMYVSGVPGTGKTATTTEVIRTLQVAAKKGLVPEFEYIDINGMRLTEPRQAYVHMYRQISGKTVAWEHAYQLLDKRFNTPSPRRPMTILLVDELDILCNKRQDVVYNILNWPTLSSAKLVVVTIANTMDLPERLLMGKITSRLGLTRLTFQPYSFQQLQEIILSRLDGTETFNKDAIQLVARKVAAVSGDCRRALDICRRAAEIAEAAKKHGSTEIDVVSIPNVQQALAEMIASPKIQFIKSCTKYEKLWLQAVCAEYSRTGVEEVIFDSVYTQMETLAMFSRIYVPTVEQALGICTRLGSSRLLICEHGRKDILMKILLNVSPDDVYYALSSN